MDSIGQYSLVHLVHLVHGVNPSTCHVHPMTENKNGIAIQHPRERKPTPTVVNMRWLKVALEQGLRVVLPFRPTSILELLLPMHSAVQRTGESFQRQNQGEAICHSRFRPTKSPFLTA